jgi:hypothetical protein
VLGLGDPSGASTEIVTADSVVIVVVVESAVDEGVSVVDGTVNTGHDTKASPHAAGTFPVSLHMLVPFILHVLTGGTGRLNGPRNATFSLRSNVVSEENPDGNDPSKRLL